MTQQPAALEQAIAGLVADGGHLRNGVTSLGVSIYGMRHKLIRM